MFFQKHADFQKYPDSSQKYHSTRFFLKMFHFSQKVQGKGKREYYSKRKDANKLKNLNTIIFLKKYQDFSQHVPFFSQCSIFSQNVSFFSKCSIVF